MRAVHVATNALVTIGLAALMVRGVFTTDLGSRIGRLVPESWWQRLESRFGWTSDESLYDAQLVVFFILSVVVAGGIVAAGQLGWRKMFADRKWGRR
jgi:hypothetical protein